MSQPPPELLWGMSTENISIVQAWWAGLSDGTQSEILTLWDERVDTCFFTPMPEQPGENGSAAVPKVIGGKFASYEDTSGWDEWHAEYFDHLVNHPELVLLEPLVERTFYICTRHEAARAALAAGRIPPDFKCPFRLEGCPM